MNTIAGDYMTSAERQEPVPGPHPQPKERHTESAVCEDSGLRRKFLDYCDGNPDAPECKLHDV